MSSQVWKLTWIKKLHIILLYKNKQPNKNKNYDLKHSHNISSVDL